MEHLGNAIRLFEAATYEPASSLHFTPVRLRARGDGWSAERQRRFVAALAATGHAGKAAGLVGMSQQTAARLRHRKDAESFARACCAAYSMFKVFRRMKAAARAKAAKGSNPSQVFFARGSELSGKSEPSTAARGSSPSVRGHANRR
jgi:hypothetical protein